MTSDYLRIMRVLEKTGIEYSDAEIDLFMKGLSPCVYCQDALAWHISVAMLTEDRTEKQGAYCTVCQSTCLALPRHSAHASPVVSAFQLLHEKILEVKDGPY